MLICLNETPLFFPLKFANILKLIIKQKSMKPKVDQATCIGCGAFAATCPMIFKMGDDGKSHVIEGVDYEANKACIDEAITICPVQAISWED